MQRESHAIIIGGSLAGLLASRVLAKHFDRVSIVERDFFPEQPAPRPGIPQSRHLHILLNGGKIILEQLFPGWENELIAAGAPSLDPRSIGWFSPAGWAPQSTPDLNDLIMFSRDLLDWQIRRRLTENMNVHFLEGGTVTGLLANASCTEVAGVSVRFRDRHNQANIHAENLYADLVVDASGKVSKTPQWLKSLGYEPPQETAINAFVGYASRIYEGSGKLSDTAPVFVSTAPPFRTRGGAIFPIEGNRWLVLLIGGDRDYPPADEAGFLEFARTLPTPTIYDALKDAEAITPVYSYRGTENRLRHYERLPRYPENLIIIGHAVCAFNPIYGQGMTVAALDAQMLDECLQKQRKRYPEGDFTGFARQFQQKLAKIHTIPWIFAISQDSRYPGSEGAKLNLATRLTIDYMDLVLKVLVGDAKVCQAFLEVLHMIESPAVLFSPSIALKAIGQLVTVRQKA
ncbi:2-polyprenyl-6-methoxyphenol hydroxylase-like oxidoreductase [Microcoleus vaginatus]|uniref:2-polyprenyl-6-methoxyphenol hydroxylase-like oxidoreductase n=1 Tax=Microcoleus vaginatus TaxID=119532 RepID=UPI0016856E0B|nr:2-polyprenyl-6-methoxyphenol hydroxylase-like oxidoreductase [Microcoleus sp. FACHB-84]MBD2008263.1 2-polyprenyl-6-methoxyphenol hydroxylase-like oxidoreductase [Microcoleus sp. FACHB-45]